MQAIAMGIGSMVMSVGASAAVAGVVSTVVTQAVIGAAIGGLTAAVTGGSISKGILYGAVGGAVSGGIMGASSGLMDGLNALETGGAPMANANPYYTPVSTTPVKETTSSALTEKGGLLSGLGSSLVNAAGTMLSGSAAEDMSNKNLEATTAQSQASLEAEIAASKLNNETARRGQDITSAANIASTDLAAKQLAETQRQFNTGTQLAAEKLARQQSAVTESAAARQGVLSGGTSIDQQVYDNDKQMVG